MHVDIAAKINADIFVFPLQGAFHPIDSIFASVGLYDRVSLDGSSAEGHGSGVEVRFTGPYAQNISENDNSVIKVWQEINAKCKLHTALAAPAAAGIAKCKFNVVKNIPSGAGLGGGSADAAAVLLLCNKMFELKLSEAQLVELGSQVGSDVPFFIRGGAARVTGRGEKLSWQKPLDGWIALFKPKDIFCGTPEIYGKWDELNISNSKYQILNRKFPVTDIRPSFRNDLYHAVASLHPEYERWLWMLMRAGFGKTALTGSGAAFFAWCPRQDLALRAQGLFDPKKFDTWVLPLVSQSCLWQT